MALPARAVVTHLGEVAELAEEGGLHCDVRGRDAAEQVEHRLDGMLGGQLAFHESYRDQVAAAAFAVRIVQIASGGRVAPQARRRLLFDNKIRWILLDPSAYRGNVRAEVSDYSARHKGVTLVGQRGL